jgi:hypothetical protein
LRAACALALVATIAPGAPGRAEIAVGRPERVLRHAGPDYNGGKPLPWQAGTQAAANALRRNARAVPRRGVEVGDDKTWLALDDANGEIYFKDYRLKAVGRYAEIWVANDIDLVSSKLNFQAGDCRNGERTRVTRRQARYLARQFDEVMYPRESRWFSVAPRRNGKDAVLYDFFDIPSGYWSSGPSGGRRIVVLVDNVRDDNFYDFDNSRGDPYIAGFFFSVFNDYTDRNIMTIDGFDWLHRTRANPPDDPVPGDLCASAPARPYLYEGVFAHEYQHLLMHYEDPDEVNWVNEGLSDWAQTLAGYVDPALPITDRGFDSHVQCFLGYLGIQTDANPNPRDGGPENSLSAWGDQGDGEILCDYGAAYTMMEFLAGRYGRSFMRALHRHDDNGFAGLQALLQGRSETARDVLLDWAAVVVLDRVLDRGATLEGGAANALRVPTLDASINFDTPQAFDTPGAPPNGSDYVRLRDASGNYLSAGALSSLAFEGALTLPSKPVEWTVDLEPPGHEGDPALYSGSGPNFDRAIVRQVEVPTSDPTLRLETSYDTEELWDFGFVQVSTDGGRTYTSLANEATTSEHDPGAIPAVVDNLPGFTGSSGGWTQQTFDLSAYAGQTVHLAFRYITDSAVDLPGWWIDDVRIGSTSLSDGSSLEGWRSMTEVFPTPVQGWTVQLVAYDQDGRRAWRALVPLDDNFSAALDAGALRALVGDSAEVVAALVMYDDPSEQLADYAPYELTVNGVAQPGG